MGVKCCAGTVEGDGGTERLEAFEWDCDTLVGGRHCGYLLLYEVWRVEKHAAAEEVLPRHGTLRCWFDSPVCEFLLV